MARNSPGVGAGVVSAMPLSDSQPRAYCDAENHGQPCLIAHCTQGHATCIVDQGSSGRNERAQSQRLQDAGQLLRQGGWRQIGNYVSISSSCWGRWRIPAQHNQNCQQQKSGGERGRFGYRVKVCAVVSIDDELSIGVARSSAGQSHMPASTGFFVRCVTRSQRECRA